MLHSSDFLFALSTLTFSLFTSLFPRALSSVQYASLQAFHHVLHQNNEQLYNMTPKCVLSSDTTLQCSRPVSRYLLENLV